MYKYHQKSAPLNNSLQSLGPSRMVSSWEWVASLFNTLTVECSQLSSVTTQTLRISTSKVLTELRPYNSMKIFLLIGGPSQKTKSRIVAKETCWQKYSLLSNSLGS